MYVESRLFNSEFPGVEYVGIQYDKFEKERGEGVLNLLTILCYVLLLGDRIKHIHVYRHYARCYILI